MKIFIPKEIHPKESRAAIVPETIAKLKRLEATIQVELGLGTSIGLSDKHYTDAGAEVISDLQQGLAPG